MGHPKRSFGNLLFPPRPPRMLAPPAQVALDPPTICFRATSLLIDFHAASLIWWLTFAPAIPTVKKLSETLNTYRVGTTFSPKIKVGRLNFKCVFFMIGTLGSSSPFAGIWILSLQILNMLVFVTLRTLSTAGPVAISRLKSALPIAHDNAHRAATMVDYWI